MVQFVEKSEILPRKRHGVIYDNYGKMVIIQTDSRDSIVLKSVLKNINTKIVKLLTEYFKDDFCTSSRFLCRNRELQLRSYKAAKLFDILRKTASLRNDALFSSIEFFQAQLINLCLFKLNDDIFAE